MFNLTKFILLVKLLIISSSESVRQTVQQPCIPFPLTRQGQLGSVEPPELLQAVQESASRGHAVVEARRVFQRGDSVERSLQNGVRLANLGQESIPMA